MCSANDRTDLVNKLVGDKVLDSRAKHKHHDGNHHVENNNLGEERANEENNPWEDLGVFLKAFKIKLTQKHQVLEKNAVKNIVLEHSWEDRVQFLIFTGNLVNVWGSVVNVFHSFQI